MPYEKPNERSKQWKYTITRIDSKTGIGIVLLYTWTVFYWTPIMKQLKTSFLLLTAMPAVFYIVPNSHGQCLDCIALKLYNSTFLKWSTLVQIRNVCLYFSVLQIKSKTRRRKKKKIMRRTKELIILWRPTDGP